MRHIHIQTTNIRKYKQFLTTITRGEYFMDWERLKRNIYFFNKKKKVIILIKTD